MEETEEGVEQADLMAMFRKQVYDKWYVSEHRNYRESRVISLLEDIAVSLRKIAACEIGTYNLLAEAQKIAKENQNGTEA